MRVGKGFYWIDRMRQMIFGFLISICGIVILWATREFANKEAQFGNRYADLALVIVGAFTGVFALFAGIWIFGQS